MEWVEGGNLTQPKWMSSRYPRVSGPERIDADAIASVEYPVVLWNWDELLACSARHECSAGEAGVIRLGGARVEGDTAWIWYQREIRRERPLRGDPYWGVGGGIMTLERK